MRVLGSSGNFPCSSFVMNLYMFNHKQIDSRSTHFISNLRSYNNMFAFTSLSGKVESEGNDGYGPPRFVRFGHNYHQMGSLLPSEGQKPKFNVG